MERTFGEQSARIFHGYGGGKTVDAFPFIACDYVQVVACLLLVTKIAGGDQVLQVGIGVAPHPVRPCMAEWLKLTHPEAIRRHVSGNDSSEGQDAGMVVPAKPRGERRPPTAGGCPETRSLLDWYSRVVLPARPAGRYVAM